MNYCPTTLLALDEQYKNLAISLSMTRQIPKARYYLQLLSSFYSLYC